MVNRGRESESVRRSSQDSEDSNISADDLIDLTGSRQREESRAITLPHRNPPLPNLWSEIEHLESKVDVEIFKKHGPLAALLNHRISELRILDKRRSSDNFMIPIIALM